MAEQKENKIVFYCKTCEKIIKNPKKMARRYVYICPECKTKNVAFGTDTSIKMFYRIEDEKHTEENTSEKKKSAKKKVSTKKVEKEEVKKEATTGKDTKEDVEKESGSK